MNLEVTDLEKEMLVEILQDRLGSLREEIHHSMTSSFTDDLKRKEKMLKGVLDKLGAQPGGGSSS